MPMSTYSEEQLQVVVDDVLRFCRQTDTPPMRANRDRWAAWEGRSVPVTVAKLAWSEVKRRVAREWLPENPLPDGHALRGVSTYVDKDGNVRGQWVKTREDRPTREEVLERLISDLPPKVPNRDVSSPPVPDGLDDSLLAAYVMGDPHLGMLAWRKETQDEDFDLPTAEHTLTEAMRYLVAQGRPARGALIVNLGDFFHADNFAGVTSRGGHQLDVDTRWPKLLRVGLRCMINLVELALARHEHVRVINEIGNHDDHSSFFLSVALDAYFSDEPRVDVDLSPARFHYVRHGKCLIGVTHGHATGAKTAKDLEAIMAVDRAQEWGETEHRYWWTGHIHHKSAQDARGSSAEAFRTLAPLDAYAANEGYRGRREMTRITLHAEHGEVARAVVGASLLRAMLEEAS